MFLLSAPVSSSYLQSYSVIVKNVPLLRLAKKLLFLGASVLLLIPEIAAT